MSEPGMQFPLLTTCILSQIQRQVKDFWEHYLQRLVYLLKKKKNENFFPQEQFLQINIPKDRPQPTTLVKNKKKY